MNPTQNTMLDTLRTVNHELIFANHQLLEVISLLDERSKERESYIRYLETVLFEIGWTPGKSHSC